MDAAISSTKSKNANKLGAFSIDAVYLWVDGSDPKWQSKKQQTFCKLTNEAASTPLDESNDPARFRDNDELRYSLRSLELYAPWINKVYIITDNQAPSWLNKEMATIVDHKDILPPSALPTFNCNAIELCMHHVPNLSEHFIYFNDDVMLGRATKKSDFFAEDGTPIIWYSAKRKKNKAHEKKPRLTAINMGRELIFEKYGYGSPHKIGHYPHVYTKSSVNDFCSTFAPHVERTIHSKFRAEDDLFLSPIYPLFMLATKRGAACPINGIHQILNAFRGKLHHLGTSLGDHNFNQKMRLIKLLRPLTFCANDAPMATDEHRNTLQKFLNSLFPNKSKFEI